MSAFQPFLSALLPKADVIPAADFRPNLTQTGHSFSEK
jgi:hypothetical protein